MSQDLLEILTGEASAPAPKARPTGTLSLPAKRMDPMDAMVRTVYGEAGGPDEHPWIAAVIANRAKASGKDFTDVVLEEGQFEPWGDAKARKRMEALSPSSPEYQTIAANIKSVLEGEDPTGGATHFYAPGAQASLGREKPEWDDGSGVQVGKSLFFRNPGSGGGTDLEALLTGGRAVAEAETPDADAAFQASFGKAIQGGDEPETVQFTADQGGEVPYSHGGGTINKPQRAFYDIWVRSNEFDPKAPSGSRANPFYTRGGNDADVEPGAYYVNDDGALRRAEGGDAEAPGVGDKIKSGLGRGMLDVAQSVGEILPGTEDSELVNRLTANQAAYDADLKGDPVAGAARFTGQMAATIPALGVAGKGAQVVAKGAGPIGQFLAGEGAQIVSKSPALQKLLGLASTATAGAAEGAGGALLVSSAGEGSKADQAKTGALLGGALGPVGGAIKSGVRRFVGGGKTAGAAPAAEQALRVEMSKGLPVEVPMSAGQVTGAPAQQLTENAMLKGVEGDAAARIMQNFADEQQAALQGNAAAITNKIAGQPVERGQGGAAVAEKLNKMRDTSKKGVDAAYDAARATGDDAMLATSQAPREAMLAKLTDYDLESVPRVAREVEKFGERGAPTVRDLLDARQRLSVLTQDSDQISAGAARKAIQGLDQHVSDALTNDLLLGDPKAVTNWRNALKARRDHGKLFDGDDMIEALTERAQRSGETTTKIDPADAANYIFGRGNLGFVGKRNLTRDVTRIKDVLGADSPEWNQLRGDLFQRFVRQGKGPNERGVETFSGQNFMNAWNKAKAEDAEVIKAMFTPEERKLIDDFAEVAQRVTTPVKGGDNSSNSAFAGAQLIKKALGNVGAMGGSAIGSVAGPGGAATGAAVGRVFDDFMKNVRSVLKAQKAVSGATPKAPGEIKNRILPSPAKTAIITQGSQRFSGQPETVP